MGVALNVKKQTVKTLVDVLENFIAFFDQMLGNFNIFGQMSKRNALSKMRCFLSSFL